MKSLLKHFQMAVPQKQPIDEHTMSPKKSINLQNVLKYNSETDFKFINNGIFGYIAYDAVRYFEDIEISKKEHSVNIPDIYYAVYQNIIAINHFKNEAYIFAHCYESENNIDDILQLD